MGSEMNKKRNKKNKEEINIEKVIHFLCNEQKFNENDLKMSKCKFAHLLFENVSVCHSPSKQILQSLRNYAFENVMGTNILPRFNEARDAKKQVDTNGILKFIQSRNDITEEDFGYERRKLVAKKLKAYNKVHKI